jgi:hypothetical protein
VTAAQAKAVAVLLRYAMSLNVTVGLVSPTQRRLSGNTQRAIELAARVLEGEPLDEALRKALETWTGTLRADHDTALDIVQNTRDTLLSDNPFFSPRELSELMEIADDHLLDLMRLSNPDPNAPGGKHS